MILILLSIPSKFLYGDVPRRPSCGVYISNLFGLPEHLRMLLISLIVTNS